MKTYTNTTRESICEAIFEAFRMAELKDYADTLVGYFCDKVEAWMTAYRNTHTDKWENEAERRFGRVTDSVRYELEIAMDDLKEVMKWKGMCDHYVSCAIMQERENPIKTKYENEEDKADAIVAYRMQLSEKYHDVLHVSDLLGLYEHTQGLKDEDFRGLLREYDII